MELKVFADGIEGYQILNIQMLRHFEGQLGVIEKGFEDAKFAEVKLRAWWEW